MKEFSTRVILSLTTGFMLSDLLSDFDKVHELAEWVAGHPIWTHELANKNLLDALREKLFAQHPSLRDFKAAGGEVWAADVKNLEREFGLTLSIAKGAEEREESPIESLDRKKTM